MDNRCRKKISSGQENLPKETRKMGPPASDDLVDVLFTLDESQAASEGSKSIFLTDVPRKIHGNSGVHLPLFFHESETTSDLKNLAPKKKESYFCCFVPKNKGTIPKTRGFFQKSNVQLSNVCETNPPAGQVVAHYSC